MAMQLRPTLEAPGTEPSTQMTRSEHASSSPAGSDVFISHMAAVVREELPLRLAHLHDVRPECVAIFDRMVSGSDEQTCVIQREQGVVAAARHVLERGNEILKDFANRPAEEFRMSMAYQKFDERSRQMMHVLRSVLQTPCAHDVESLHEKPACSDPPDNTTSATIVFDQAHGDGDARVVEQSVRDAHGVGQAEEPSGNRCSGMHPSLPQDSDTAAHDERAVHNAGSGRAEGHVYGMHEPSNSLVDGSSREQVPVAPLRVISLGGGSGNDAVGVIAFLLDRNRECGVALSTVHIPRDAVEPRPTKLTWAEKKAAKKAGIDPKKQQGDASRPAAVKNSSEFRFASDMLRQSGVQAPQHATFPACPSVSCHVLDVDDLWYDSVGACVKREMSQFFTRGIAQDGDRPFAELHWHQCDVTRPLCKLYPSLHAVESSAAAAGSTA